MTIGYMVAYFFGGMFGINGIPHFVRGIMGDTFPSPFSKPPGKGKSSPVVNVLWGTFNFVVAYLLLYQVGSFDLNSWLEFTLFAAGGLVIGLMLARTFATRIR